LRSTAPRAVATVAVAVATASDDSDPPWGEEEPDVLEDDLPEPTRSRFTNNAGQRARPPVDEEPADLMPDAPVVARGGTQPQAAPQSALPPALPEFERTALGTQWYELVTLCSGAPGFVALVRELAVQSELIACDEHGDAPTWRLRVARETLRNPTLVDKLSAIVRQQLGRPLQLRVEAGEAQDCPSRRDAAEAERRQRAAIDAIQSDPTVRALLAQFQTARILPGSIKPL
jgi:DNA polymerase-3 subunit gamma/tau